MSKSVIVLVVATLACGSASAYFWRELRAEREQTQMLQARVAELTKPQTSPAAIPETRTVEAPFAALTETDPKPENKPSVAKPVVGAVTAPAATATFAFAGPNVRNGRMDPEMQRRIQENFERQRAMLQDPEYRQLMRDQQKLGMRRMYGDMEVMLGLSKEEAERVMEVLAEQQVRSMEQRPFLASDGTQPDQAAIREQQRVFEETRRRNEAELASALGSKYSEWQEYQQSMWSRSQVMRLKETLAGSDEPLRQDQIKPLVQALAHEQQQMQMNTMRGQQYASKPPTPENQLRMQEEWLERTAQSHERVRNAVSSLLSPAQLRQLQEQQEQERKMQEINLRMQRARAEEARARGEDPNAQSQFGMSVAPMIVN